MYTGCKVLQIYTSFRGTLSLQRLCNFEGSTGDIRKPKDYAGS